MESLPLIVAVAGGALTIAGGYFNQSNLHKRQRASDARSRAATKLEEAGRHANKVRAAALKFHGVALQVALNSLGANNQQLTTDNDNEEFLLILRLYEPSLLMLADDLIKSFEELQSYVVTILAQMVLPGSHAKDLLMQMSDCGGSLFKQVERNHAAFMRNLAENSLGTVSSKPLPSGRA